MGAYSKVAAYLLFVIFNENDFENNKTKDKEFISL